MLLDDYNNLSPTQALELREQKNGQFQSAISRPDTLARKDVIDQFQKPQAQLVVKQQKDTLKNVPIMIVSILGHSVVKGCRKIEHVIGILPTCKSENIPMFKQLSRRFDTCKKVHLAQQFFQF